MKWRLLLLLCLASSYGLAQVNTVTQCQYWFDNNFAGRDSIATASSAQVTLSTGIATTGLNPGLHSFNSRFRQSDGKYSAVVSQLFIKTPAGTGTARLVSGYEYWFDNDYANRTAQSVSPASTVLLNAAISPAALSAGLHTFNIRFRDNSSIWTSTVSQLFFKAPAGGGIGAGKITAYEYWFDGNYNGRVNQTVAPTAQAEIATAISTVPLGSGVHSLNIRFKDSGNVWSTVKSSLFFKAPGSGNNASRLINGYEYWFDNNYAGKTTQSLAPAGNVLLNTAINPTTLSAGLHTLNIRFRDNSDGWTSTVSQLFLKAPAGGSGSRKVAAYEYWFDNDYGGLVNQAVAPAAQAEIATAISTAALSNGVHSFSIRFKDSGNVWSVVKSSLFFKSPGSGGNASRLINGYEYWFDNDFAGRQSQPVAPSAQLQLATAINPSTVPNGVHTLHVRFKDNGNAWSSVVSALLLKQASSASIDSNVITAMRYWIDTARSQMKKIYVAAPMKQVTLLAGINANGLDTGKHYIYFQFQDTLHSWSSVRHDSFRYVSQHIVVGTVADSVCAGAGLPVLFTLNYSYNSTNVFTLQLSDASGNFAAPVTIGSLPGNAAGTISATIPAAAPAGAGYRIRIIASSPADTSGTKAIVIRRVPEQAFAINGPLLVCTGSASYSISGAQAGTSYAWQVLTGGTVSAAGTGATVNWTSAGTHLLTATASNTCGTGSRDTISVTVQSGPPAGSPTVSKSGDYMLAAALIAGVSGYQWYRNDTLIAGATDSSYAPLVTAVYKAAFTNVCGAGSPSAGTYFYVRAPQSIAFAAIAGKTYGASPFSLGAVASSGLPVAYTISGPALLTGGDTLMITGAGTVVVTARQEGDTAFKPATPVVRSFVVAKAAQTVSLNPIGNKTYGDAAFAVSATASTGLPVSYSILSGPASLNGSLLSLTGGGPVVVRASQGGNQNYLPAFANDTFCVSAPQPDTIRGYAVSCISSQRYYVDSVPGVSYAWSLSGGGSLSATAGGAVNVSWASLGNHTLTVAVTTSCNSTAKIKTLAVQVAVPLSPGAPTNLYPADSTSIGSFPSPFSWQPGTNTQVYDLYIWQAGNAVPSTPTFAGLASIGRAVKSNNLTGFAPGAWYQWKVVARNACGFTSSVTRSFRVADLPDLTVPSIVAPDTAFSNTNITVAVTVRNIGHALTSGTWYDNLSISADSLTNFVAPTILDNSPNVAALDTQQSYTRTLTVTLPQNLVGANFLHATAGPASAEISTANNHRYRSIYIKQSPLPDLRVQSVLTTGNTFSGNDITVTWTVKNHGTGNTAIGSWYDYVYISQDSVFGSATAILMSAVRYQAGTLYHDSAYTRTKTVSLPVSLFGKCYVYVLADGGNDVYESAFENNNTARSDSLIIYLTPPPDYQIVNFNVPQNLSRGETVLVDWTIKNAGAIRRTKDSVWTDGISISPDSAGNAVISTRSFSPPRISNPACNPTPLVGGPCPKIIPPMDAEDQYYQSGSITLPMGYDSVFIRLKTDNTNAIFEYLNEGNNTATVKRKFLKPDLSVQSIYLPVPLSPSFASNQYTVRWDVKNGGPGKMAALPRKDVIFLSHSPTLNQATALRLDSLEYSTPIDTGNTISLLRQVRLPDTVSSGAYYVIIKTDADNVIPESVETNNLSFASFQLHMPKPSDLYVTQVTAAPSSLISEQKIRLAYIVRNQDSGAVLGQSWVDKVYLSKAASWNKDSAVLIATYSRASSLALNETYTADDSILIKSSYLQQLHLDSTSCYLYVWTDADTQVYEGSHEGNNVTRSNAVYMRLITRPDLEETALTLPDSLWSGKTGSLSWSVTNRGGTTSHFTSYWQDGLYLSTDTVLSASDLLLRTAPQVRQLDSNQQYSNQTVFTVPNGLSGNYYLLMVADDGDRTADRNRNNNYKILHRANGDAWATYISLTPPPDLVVDSLSIPPVSYSGQPSMVKWRVKNAGSGPTAGGVWYEQFYLSRDTILDVGDISLDHYKHSGDLNPDGAYSDSMMLYMPINAEGNYYLLAKTDFNNLIYEHNSEGNNVAHRLCFVIRPDPADLTVRDVTVDSICIAGDTASVSWVVENRGVNPASGYMRQGIYLSGDVSWSNDDVIMDYPDCSIALAPGDTAHYSARFRVKDVAAGAYYAIIRTDLRNNIVEENDANNDGASSAPLQVTIPQLPLDTIKYNVLRRNYELYYRLDIPAALAGQTVSVTLKGDSVNGLNELYLRHDSIATRARYDYKYDQPGGNQVIVIPEAKAGTYYVLAYGASSATAQQNISLLAKRISFSILSFQSHDGGNKGNVTIRISGAKFAPGMMARLQSPLLGTITAASVYYVSSTLAYATFNLSGKMTGAYSLKLLKPGIDSVVAADLFTIVAGKGGTTAGGGNSSNSNGFLCTIKNIGVEDLLGFEVQHPGSTPPQRVFPMTVIFANSGDQDIPVPTRMLISEDGYPLSFTTTRLSEGRQELFLEFREVDGPPGLLRPGAVGYITVFTKSGGGGAVMHFSLIE